MAHKVEEVNFDGSENIDLSHKDDDDNDEDVKDNWDDDSEDEEAKKPASVPVAQDEVSKPPAKKKSLKDKIAEKEAEKERLAEMTRLKLEAMNRTPEEIASEKARIRKEQEDSDFDLARDTFADSSPLPSTGAGLIDTFEPNTAETFDQFRKILVDKLQKYQKSQFYPIFLQGFFQDLSLNLNSEDVRKCASLLTTLAGEKAKKEKESSGKGKAKAKAKTGKGSLLAGKKDDQLDDYGNDYDPIDDLL